MNSLNLTPLEALCKPLGPTRQGLIAVRSPAGKFGWSLDSRVQNDLSSTHNPSSTVRKFAACHAKKNRYLDTIKIAINPPLIRSRLHCCQPIHLATDRDFLQVKRVAGSSSQECSIGRFSNAFFSFHAASLGSQAHRIFCRLTKALRHN